MLVAVLNGVNLNLLDRRDPGVYGGLSLPQLEERIRGWGQELGLDVVCRQTNSEGEYVEWCQELGESASGLVVNPGAWSHYSYAIHDALELARGRVVEVHLSDIGSREEWRRHSVLEDLAAHRVIGKGPEGYREALEFLARG
ncbi:MAG TPA: type II 3-dehydroquinate dehydratase [Gaiellaceae bacterium]|jgi:3-dehydroquinate dehydratase-2|nr:type II 3-dehydroquinate dehydratase [Gaiellaceae bacterium]